MIKNYSLLCFILLFYLSCEENPFSSKSEIPHRTIKGFVNLDGIEAYPNGNHSGVFVWAHELGLRTLTGADGSFQLELPAASTPSGGGIADGDYAIYFFMANYKIASIQITFAGGEILNDDRVIKINGELRKIISIDRMVQIHTSIEPSTIPTTFEDDIKVEIKATPDRSDIFFYLLVIEAARQPTVYSGLLIKDISSDKLVYSFNPDTAGTIKRFIEQPFREFLINFKVVDDSLNPVLSPGSYEAIPYLIIESNEDPPSHLLDALESGYDDFSEKYFDYPIYRTGGKFTIIE